MSSLNDKRLELARLVSQIAVDEGFINSSWPGLGVARISQTTAKEPLHYKPSICFILQGQKHVFLQDRKYVYDPFNYLVVPMSLPLDVAITQASEQHPLLGLGLELDLSLLSELLVNIEHQTQISTIKSDLPTEPALFVSAVAENILDALIRLLNLLSKPNDLKILGKSIEREILYWALQSEQGESLRQFVLKDSSSHRILNTINFLNQNYTEEITIDGLSQMSSMSSSALHQKFKQVTRMSPLQYLKKIRLHNARNLMLEQGVNANDAAFKVGYANPSQFSREFKRMFGLPPMAMKNSVS